MNAYGFFLCIALTTGYGISLVVARPRIRNHFQLLTAALVVAFFIGAKLPIFLSGKSLDNAGSFFPGVMLCLLTCSFLAERLEIPMREILDAYAPGFALAVVFVRMGCFLSGCCWGTETTVAWAVTYGPEVSTGVAPFIPRHPVQLYEALGVLALFFVLTSAKGRPFPGRPATILGGGYSILRFILAFFRETTESSPFGLHISGMHMIWAATAGTAVILFFTWRGRDELLPTLETRRKIALSMTVKSGESQRA